MKEKLHYIVLAFLGFVVFGYSQETEVEEPVYDWVWAHNGGGDKDMGDSPLGNTGDWRWRYRERTDNYEQVVDIQVDADNNSYILAIIGEQNTRFSDEEVAVYNYTNRVAASSDVLLISLDCEGRTRWMRVVGGYGPDKVYSLGLDAQGGLYVGMTIDNRYSHFAQEEDPNYWVERLPPYFDEETHLPYINANLNNWNEGTPHEGMKSVALVKYHTVDGSLAWVQYPEDLISLYRPGAIEDFLENGTPYFPNLMGTANKVITEADGTTHWLVAFRPGSHLNGSIVVPENDAFLAYHEFHVLVYYGNGTLKRSFKVPLTSNHVVTNGGGGIFDWIDFHNFWYDGVTQQYYLGGIFYGGSGGIPPPSFGGVSLTDGAYVLAFDPNGNELWRTTTDENLHAEIRDLKTDEVGNVYITGTVQNRDISFEGYFGNYLVPVTKGIPYVFKLTPDTGSVSWASFANRHQGGVPHGIYAPGERLVLSENEVVLATKLYGADWGDFESNIIESDWWNPFIVRLSKATGVAKGLYRIDAGKTTPSVMQAAAVDNDGNIIAGGFHSAPLFANHAVVSPLEVQGHGYVDFFVAKLAATECGTPVVFPEEDGGLSTDKQHRGKAVIYPNPTNDRVYWESDIDWRYVEVYDVLGKTVLKANVQETSVSLGHLTSSTYILALFDYEGNKTMEKVVLRR